MSGLDLNAIRKRVETLCAPLTEDARMEAYWFEFDRTGVGVMDAVLSAVAVAGKGAHSTEAWSDDDCGWYYSERPGLPQEASSAVELIEKTAARSASQIAELSADMSALIGEVERLRAQLDAVKKIVRSPGITTVKGSPADKILRIIEGGDHQ